MRTNDIEAIEIARRYLAMWNEPDSERRRQIIHDLWSPDGACLSEHLEPRGYEGLEARAAAAHERWVVQGGFRFFPLEDATGHHNVVRFRWKMALTGEAEPESTGQDFFVLDESGRIVVAYQFVDS